MLALTYNAHKGKDAPCLTDKDFDPYERGGGKPKEPDIRLEGKEAMALLRRLYCPDR